MTSLAFGKGTYRRNAAGLPELRLINMYVEAAATSQDGIVLLSRPGLVSDQVRGDGPVRGLYQREGVLSGALAAVSGGTVTIGNVSYGLSGDGAISFAGRASQLLVTGGAGLVVLSDATGTSVGFPDDADVASVAQLGGYFIAARAGTQRFYWSALNDAAAWDGLDYASAESSPDPLLDTIVIGDVLWLLGASTIEPWALTGDADLPFARIEGRNFERGVLATGCSAALDNALFWIGDDHRIYRSGSVPVGLSDPGIEERIAASNSASAFAFEYAGHKFFCVRLDTETLAFDVATQEWCEFATFARSNWQIGCAAQVNGVPRFGDAATGTIWRFDVNRYTDGNQPLVKLFTAFQPVSDGSATLYVLHLDADFGSTPLLTGQGSDPIAELRTSRDGGRTWAGWRQAKLGAQGRYRARALWRRFGSFDAPGGIFEIRTSDPVRFRVSAVRANEAQGGRSR